LYLQIHKSGKGKKLGKNREKLKQRKVDVLDMLDNLFYFV